VTPKQVPGETTSNKKKQLPNKPEDKKRHLEEIEGLDKEIKFLERKMGIRTDAKRKRRLHD